MTAIKGRIIALWKSMSLPYPELGIRLIRQDQIETFNVQIASLKVELGEAVRQLDQHFADMKSAARERLGSLYNPSDYPTSLLGLFQVAWDYPSLQPPDYLAQLNPEIYIVARCDSMEHTQKLERAGANQVLFPHMYGGLRMAQSVLRPTVLGFMDLAMRGDIEDLQMEQLTISTDSSVAGQDLIESQLRQRFNVIVIGIKKPDGKLLFNPQPQAVLEAGDTLILVGGKQNLAEMQKQLT